MIYTVPWCPQLESREIPGYVMDVLLQIDERINQDIGEPVEIGFFLRCMMRDTGLSEHAATSLLGLAALLGMVNLATIAEMQL